MIDAAIAALPLDRKPRGLYEPIAYALGCGGKRLRPALVLAAAEALGADAEGAMSQALGVEMFHNFTLLHDDVMDNADVRRGQPTVHKRYGANTAILSGDAMLTLASRLVAECAPERLPAMLELFDDTAMGVYEGQQLDMDFERRDDVTVDEYLEMIRLKTSVLLGCACATGALMAGADKKSTDAFYAFGENLGISFQLKDDWLDTFGDTLTFGKAIGGDILNAKKTWLLITALNESSGSRLLDIITSDITDSEKIERVSAVYASLGLSQRCRALEEEYARKAVEALEEIKLTAEARDFFTTLANDSLNRTR